MRNSMHISPFLPQEPVEQVYDLLHKKGMQEAIIQVLAPLSTFVIANKV
jgi:hypothetical protein